MKGFTLSLHKRFYEYNRISKHGAEKHSVYSENISEKAKINVENLSEFPVTFFLFLPVVLGINGIIISTFIELNNISITEIEWTSKSACRSTIFVIADHLHWFTLKFKNIQIYCP